MQQQIVIIANPDKPEAMRLAKEAEKEFVRHGDSVYLSTAIGDNLAAHDPELAVVFGGDGTVLGAVAGLGENPPPILAFNLGRLGYLADNPPHRVSEIIQSAKAGELQTSRRMMVDASIRSSHRVWNCSALNEFVLCSRQSGRLLHMSVWVDGEELMDVRGDGMIIGTPTGSTAYIMSVGGSVASPELSAIILAPLCPHQLANRSLVLDPRETVQIRHHTDKPVELLADGRFCLAMERGEVLDVRMSRKSVRFLAPCRGKYKLLRKKLGWGWKAEDDERQRNA